MIHSPGFEKLANEVRQQIQEIPAKDVVTLLESGKPLHFVDVREESEWAAGHLPLATHLSKGIIERDIEKAIPKKDDLIILYCGGGYRSAFAAQNLQKMGYTQVKSMAGGYRGWVDGGLPMTLRK